MEARQLTNTQFCGFRIGDEEFAIPIEDIQEVIKPLPVTLVPLSQESVRGLINLRGQIVTCISLRSLFHMEDPLDKNFMNIIVKSEEETFSLVVDEVTDILEIEEGNLEKVPDTLNENLRKFVHNIYKKSDSLVILLDTKKLTNIELNQ